MTGASKIPSEKPRTGRLFCRHEETGTVCNRAQRRAFKTDCGSRARCPAARRRWRNGMRERLCAVKYFRAPDLWTFTTRTADQDAFYRARRMRLADADAVLIEGRDRGDVSKENLAIARVGLTSLVRCVTRQFERQGTPGYMESRHARRLHREYGTALPVRGRAGAALHVRVREAGELRGRLHVHVASDFDFINHAWLKDAALRCGLGFPQYERRESKEMHRAARFSGPAVRSQTVGYYLSKYLSKSADDAPWPWPAHTRLVSAGLKRKLPARVPKEGWTYRPGSVAAVIVLEFGEVICDQALQYQEERVVCVHTLRGERCPWPGG